MALDVMKELTRLRDDNTRANERTAKAEERAVKAEAEVKALASTPKTAQHVAPGGFGVPHVTTGPVGDDSRPYSFCKAIGVMTDKIKRENAKQEWDASDRFRAVLKAAGYVIGDESHLLIPFAADELLINDVRQSEPVRQFKAMTAAGRADPDEMRWLADKAYTPEIKAQLKANGLLHSFLDESRGGSLVAPATMGELVTVYRNKSIFDQVGVQNLALPPNGRMLMPRQTDVTTGYWVGEGEAITQSGIRTGQGELNARKLAAYTYLPNELIRFASPSADALVTNDIGTTLALLGDKAGLIGTGGTHVPKGLYLYTGTGEVIFYEGVAADSGGPAAANVGASGNYLVPDDGDKMLGLLEDRNFTPDAFLFRPSAWRRLRTVRTDAVTAGDGAGLYLVNPTRAFADTTESTWNGLTVARSSQMGADRSKGTATTLTSVVVGQFKDNVIRAQYGAIEFLASNVTNNALSNDLTYVRGLQFMDWGFKRPGGFAVYDNLIGSRAS